MLISMFAVLQRVAEYTPREGVVMERWQRWLVCVFDYEPQQAGQNALTNPSHETASEE